MKEDLVIEGAQQAFELAKNHYESRRTEGPVKGLKRRKTNFTVLWQGTEETDRTGDSEELMSDEEPESSENTRLRQINLNGRGIQSHFSFQSTGIPGRIAGRNLPCNCVPCMRASGDSLQVQGCVRGLGWLHQQLRVEGPTELTATPGNKACIELISPGAIVAVQGQAEVTGSFWMAVVKEITPVEKKGWGFHDGCWVKVNEGDLELKVAFFDEVVSKGTSDERSYEIWTGEEEDYKEYGAMICAVLKPEEWVGITERTTQTRAGRSSRAPVREAAPARWMITAPALDRIRNELI